MKLRNLQENSGPWRICDFYLLNDLPANADIHRTVGVDRDDAVVPVGDEDISASTGKPFPYWKNRDVTAEIGRAPQSRSNITARFDPSGDWISLEMRLSQRSQAVAARMANPANISSEVRIFYLIASRSHVSASSCS
jgi:hypothetical protein